MPEVTQATIQDFIIRLREIPEYKNYDRVRALVDEKAPELLTLAARDLNEVETLKAIDAILKEIAAGIKAVPKKTWAEIFAVLDSVELPETILDKLMKSLDEMVETVRVFDFTAPPIFDFKFRNALKNDLDVEQLRQILKFEKPTVVITPPGSFEDKVDRINFYKTMPGQNPTFCEPAPADAIWGPAPTDWTVTIVDGGDAMPPPAYITNDLKIGQKMDKYEEEFAKKNMEVMSCHEGAMLMMQSLRFGKPIDDMRTTDTLTYYNRKRLTEYSFDPCGYWNSENHEVRFICYDPGDTDNNLRCRPSVRVL